MKRRYWKTRGEYWEWEKTGKIYVYGLSRVSNNEIERVIDIINDVLTEFALPLSVKNGNTHNKKDDFEQLIRQCSDNDGKIDFESLEEEINRLRREDKILPYGIVILVDETKYSFKDPEAVYGSASPEGVIVIRKIYINEATKHEFGHMIGIGEHHGNCVMSYVCTYEEFCEKCRNEIKEMWEI